MCGVTFVATAFVHSGGSAPSSSIAGDVARDCTIQIGFCSGDDRLGKLRMDRQVVGEDMALRRVYIVEPLSTKIEQRQVETAQRDVLAHAETTVELPPEQQ